LPWIIAGFGALCALAGTVALAYGGVASRQPPGLGGALLRPLFAVALAGALYLAGVHPFLLIALGAAALGDLALAFERRSLLAPALLALTISVLAYATILLFRWIFAGDLSPLWPRYAGMAVVILAALGLLVWLAPRLGWLALGVVPYTLATTAMACAGLWQEWRAWPVMIGVLLFGASQALMLSTWFRPHADASEQRLAWTMAWFAYAAAQGLIVAGLLVRD
jgi:uncharacterized membrane protein YhhN